MRSSAIASLPRCGWQIVCTRKRIRSEREIEVLFVTAAAAASSAGGGPKRVRLGGLHACVHHTENARNRIAVACAVAVMDKEEEGRCAKLAYTSQIQMILCFIIITQIK